MPSTTLLLALLLLVLVLAWVVVAGRRRARPSIDERSAAETALGARGTPAEPHLAVPVERAPAVEPEMAPDVPAEPEPMPAPEPTPVPQPAPAPVPQPEHARAPEAEPVPAPGATTPPPPAAGGPEQGWTIKGQGSTRAFHTPESPWYGRMRADVWFPDESAARAAGFRRWDEEDGADSGPSFEEARYGAGSAVPGADGSGPAGWTVKGNEDVGVYHTAQSAAYGRTKAQVWFRDEEAARAAGFRRWDDAGPRG